MPSNAPTASGTNAVRAAYEHVFGTIKLDIVFTVDEIVVENNVAFARTGSKGKVTILAKKITAPEENRELFVFQKIGGTWKIARYMFNKTS
jgi:ketosteroid isomerase-like protein